VNRYRERERKRERERDKKKFNNFKTAILDVKEKEFTNFYEIDSYQNFKFIYVFESQQSVTPSAHSAILNRSNI